MRYLLPLALVVSSWQPVVAGSPATFEVPQCAEDSVSVATTPIPPQTTARLAAQNQLLAAAPQSADVVVVGDSIAEQWSAIPDLFPDASVFRYAVGGDNTQITLWRLEQLPPLRPAPSAVVLAIGTNNLSNRGEPACALTAGILEVISTIHSLWPTAHVYYLPILPRGEAFKFDDAKRRQVNEDTAEAVASSPWITEITVDEDALTCGKIGAPDPLKLLRDLTSSVVSWPPVCRNYRDDQLHLAPQGYEVLTPRLAAAIGR